MWKDISSSLLGAVMAYGGVFLVIAVFAVIVLFAGSNAQAPGWIIDLNAWIRSLF